MISVIVPVYNSAKNLETCLLSLVNQTIKDLEIIIIDDASTDNSKEIIESFVNKYKNIKVHYNSKNLGAGAARNIGLSIATGKYIGFVDSDDYVNSTMYEYMIDEATKNDFPDIVMTELVFVKNDDYASTDLEFASQRKSYKIKDKVNFMYDLSPSVCNKIFKRELIESYQFLEGCKWEDIAFTFFMFILANDAIVLNNPDYFYRRDISSCVSSINYYKNSKIMEIFRVTDSLIEDTIKAKKYDKYKIPLNLICISYILTRVAELEKWDCSLEEKQKIKESIFDNIYQRYGDLTLYDEGQIYVRVPFEIADDYQRYCDLNLNQDKNIFK